MNQTRAYAKKLNDKIADLHSADFAWASVGRDGMFHRIL